MKYLAAILLTLAIALPVQAQLTVPQGGTGTTTVPSGWFLTGSSALRLIAQQFIDLASDITGTLGVGNGGTGATSFSAGQLLYGSGTGAIGTVASTTVSCAGSVSCSTFTVLGASPFTITGTTGLATTSPWTAGQLTQVADNGSVRSIATSSLNLLTTHVSEGSNLYFTNGRARGAISLTTTGTSGASTYDNTTGVFNIPQYAGTTYTASYPITLTGSAFGLAFGTTTANTWSAANTFNGTTTHATSTFARVGIGTSDPNTRLQVGNFNTAENTYLTIDAAAGFQAGFNMRSAGSNAFQVYRPASSVDLRIYGQAFGADILTVNTTLGRVGIGTTSPMAKLAIGGDVVVGASTAGGTAGDLYLPKLATGAGTFLAADATGKVIATTTPSGGSTASSTQRVYTASTTWSKPTGLRYIVVEVQGAGGGSGGCTTQFAVAGGAGAGGYSRETIAAASLASSESVTVGTGGTRGSDVGGNGTAGNLSSFGSFLTGNGGAASNGCTSANSGSAGGAGGTATGGDLNIPGGAGARGLTPGSSASVAYSSGYGGSSQLGTGAPPAVAVGATPVEGITGAIYGGGASGASNGTGSGDNFGGTGADGVVIVTEYF